MTLILRRRMPWHQYAHDSVYLSVCPTYCAWQVQASRLHDRVRSCSPQFLLQLRGFKRDPSHIVSRQLPVSQLDLQSRQTCYSKLLSPRCRLSPSLPSASPECRGGGRSPLRRAMAPDNMSHSPAMVDMTKQCFNLSSQHISPRGFDNLSPILKYFRLSIPFPIL